MITETGIIGREVVAEVMTGMNVTDTAAEIDIIVAGAGAAVPVLITRVVEGGAMMMSVVVEARADQWIGLHTLILNSFNCDFLPLSFFFDLFIVDSLQPLPCTEQS